MNGSNKKKLKAITNDYKQLLTAYKQLQASHKQVIKQLQASHKTNYKDMMKIYLELKKQGFNDNYIYNYILNK